MPPASPKKHQTCLLVVSEMRPATGLGLDDFHDAAYLVTKCAQGRADRREANAMNVVLVVCDTLRRDHLGCYGNPWIQTPNIDALAERGAAFDNYYCGSFPTLPCRNEMLMGKYEFPWRGWSGPDRHATQLSGLVRDSGRTSYLITDIPHHWGKDGGSFWIQFSGFEIIRGQERDNWMVDADLEPLAPTAPDVETSQIDPHLKSTAYLRRNEEDWFAPQVFSRAIRWIQHNAAHQDFFLMIDAFDPHEPWDPPKYYTDLYGDPDYQGNRFIAPRTGPIDGYLSEEEFNHVKAMYAGEITMVDKWFGRLVDQIELAGVLDDTMIILTTDHGTYLGNRGQVGKLQTYMYQEISHIPMIVSHPSIGRGQRVEQFVQPVDLFPTILGSIGIECPEGVHGQSLTPLMDKNEDAPARDYVLFGKHDRDLNITDGEYTLYRVVEQRRKPEGNPFDPFLAEEYVMFHLPSDPEEKTNIAQSQPEQAMRLRRAMKAELQAIDSPDRIFEQYGLKDI